MSIHFQLIPWNMLTTAIDTLQHMEDNKPTMTYEELLIQLLQQSPDKLSQTVTIYDKDTDEQIRADSSLFDNNGKLFIKI